VAPERELIICQVKKLEEAPVIQRIFK
ncbi:MAG: hypothetical protein UY94_C0014G0005, partial [Parcubacteria group bacterium GW2011_GWA2_56_21]